MAKINVGAATESEMKEKKARVEDAMHATRAANQEGILPGGGVALLRAAEGLKPKGLDARRGDRLQHRRPRLQVADHADRRERRRGRRRRRQQGAGEQRRRTTATTPALDQYCDMVKEGIIDPTKVVRCALQNAASVATLLLTSDALVAEHPRTRRSGPAAAPRHGRHVLIHLAAGHRLALWRHSNPRESFSRGFRLALRPRDQVAQGIMTA